MNLSYGLIGKESSKGNANKRLEERAGRTTLRLSQCQKGSARYASLAFGLPDQQAGNAEILPENGYSQMERFREIVAQSQPTISATIFRKSCRDSTAVRGNDFR
ncbi:hypothetical protein [Sphingobium sp.]|uniref:hypothetical protein n=1 Tax=Sphingobium sp. TaxID=1912891 RepID=UPI0028BF57D6|nr:hypothetical protein [Sphingobium sp.]